MSTKAGAIQAVVVDEMSPKNSRIEYGSKISVMHKGICSFSKPENAVQLECTIRLLRKGYAPEQLTLERSWPSGHGTSGRLDILIHRGKGAKRRAFAMVECKQWGKEYQDERANLIDSGGQLFSYAIQEATTEYVLLYASRLSSAGRIEYLAEQVAWGSLVGTNQSLRHTSWDKSLELDGIFSEASTPYLSKKVNLKKGGLHDLDEESGKGMFHAFAEVLRRHAISDKSNAFNKIFNLFVCKICDEDYKSLEDEVDFQWKTNDSFRELIETRLASLYVKGVHEYLGIVVDPAYFSAISEFSFVDIYNQESYDRNGRIVREVVELLQPFNLKYTKKQQFLGDFFEDLLNSGIKQEAGQFFTPTVLARFFSKALPLAADIDKRVADKKPDVIPTVIDPACGAGHFLTECIDELQERIDCIEPSALMSRYQKRFLAIRENFYWTKDYVYGIEKDYRLAKTTKIAMFLYGDGDAVIINGDGLDDFAESKTYKGKLLSPTPVRNVSAFDVVISNPPFSIAGFKGDLPHAATSFSLSDSVGSASSEIECFFTERFAQLLADGGYLGVILPLSILNNDRTVYREARKLLLTHFQIRGLVELRDKTFKPTNTTTVGVFARKRTRDEVASAIDALCGDLIAKRPSPKLLAALARLNIDGAEGIKNLRLQAKEMSQRSTAAALLAATIPDLFAEVLSHRLNAGAEVVLAYSGEKKDQEAFLGYRFSRSRGKEGIEIFRDENGQIKSALFSESTLNDPAKVNAHILAAFNGSRLPIPNGLSESVTYVPLNDIVSQRPSFIIENPSSAFASGTEHTQSLSPLGDFIDSTALVDLNWSELKATGALQFVSGLVYKKSSETPTRTSKRVLTASNLDIASARIRLDTKLVYLKPGFEIPKAVQPKKDDILMCIASGSLKHLGKVVWVEEDMPDTAVGGFLMIIRCKEAALAKALFYRLASAQFRKHVSRLRGQNISNLDEGKITAAALTIPADLKRFFKDAAKREEGLAKATARVRALRS